MRIRIANGLIIVSLLGLLLMAISEFFGVWRG